MTPAMQKAWDREVVESLKGVKDSEYWVALIVFSDLRGEGITAPVGEPPILNTNFSPAQTTAYLPDQDSPAKRLGITFNINGELNLIQNGKPFLVPFSKKLTYYLVPHASKDMPWLIDSYEGTWTV